jgi:xanthine phosphoribosyltransferase
MKKLILTWENVEEYVGQVVRLYENENPCGVYGIPRGGIILAVMISHRLGIPLLNAPAPGCIVVDDICDTGESLIHYAKNSSAISKPKYIITTMMYRRNGVVEPGSYWGIKRDEWVIFPWEDGAECTE